MLLLSIQIHYHLIIIRAVALTGFFRFVMVEEVFASVLIAWILNIALIFGLDRTRLDVFHFRIVCTPD